MKTKYSNCKCGETAFDRNAFNVFENNQVVIRTQYRCRNCQRLLKTKKNESNAHLFNMIEMKEMRI